MDVPRLYILIGLVAFAAVDHVASQTDEECRFSSSARRRRCPFGVRRGDRIGCIRQGCCYDESVSSRASVRIQCYQKERPLSFGFGTTTQPPALQNQNTGYLNFGGEPGYPGSTLIKRCSGGPCFGFQSLPRGFCSRIGCCYDAQRRQCFSNIFTFIRLRPNCRPGFENAPSCREINECDPNPCVNGVNCIDLINDFLCCVGEPEGQTCDQVCPFPTLTSTDGGLTPVFGGPFGLGETLSFSCEIEGYTISGSVTLTCTKNGAFDNSAPTCESLPCTSPPAPFGVTTRPIRTEYSVFSVVQYSCINGLPIIAGEPTSNTCLPGGDWEFTSGPTCTGCPRPNDVTGGTFGSDENVFAVNEMLTFSCNVGFTISTGGTTSATCQAGTFLFNPSFSGTQCFPNCAQDDATLDPLGNLDIDPNQPATGNGYSFGTVLTYSCTDTSQAFVGESTLTCQTNGNYDNPVVPGQAI
ncbi:P-selectin-like [Clavelina lepadiformis]|uniref:P-selectin-like n=1 Tax=Clavelina lepadiformis TaxID=159417 RepID=UPI004043942E